MMTWYVHADDVVDRDWKAANPQYIGRHRRAECRQEFTFESTIARAVTDVRRADQAVEVLAATDDLPASRILYRELLRAGALPVVPS